MAIVDSAKAQGIKPQEVINFSSIAGKGVEALLNNRPLLFGNAKLMTERGVNTCPFLARTQVFAEEAKTPIYFAVNNKLAAVIALAESIKSDSIEAIKRLDCYTTTVFDCCLHSVIRQVIEPPFVPSVWCSVGF